MTNSTKITVPFQRVPRRPLGEVFTGVQGTVSGLPVTITLTNDELHIQPHFDAPAASVDLMVLTRAVVGELIRNQFGPQEKR